MSCAAPSSSPPALPAVTQAALLVVARQHLVELSLPHPTVLEIIDKTQAGRSRAYELADRLPPLLSQLVGPNGRPKKTPSPVHAEDETRFQLTQRVLNYVMAHPGCVSGSANRRNYSSGFRRFIVKLRAEYPDKDLSGFAAAVNVSAHTLEDWLRPGRKLASENESSSSPSPHESKEESVTSTQIGQIVHHWRKWEGNFTSFCKHVKAHLRIPFGMHQIRTILFMYGERTPGRRSGRSADEEAIREQYRLFFPDAQWQGDGMQIPVILNGERFEFNFELNVDSYSGAWVGMSLRDEEDSQAVIDAMQDGVQNTGKPPLAEVLDHRPSNHTDEVQEAFKNLDVEIIPATKGRPQNKAHAEGSFGLFSQEAPLLEVQASNSRELAQEILRLVLQTYGRALNHRPRRDRDEQSRFEIHENHTPSEKQIAEAKEALKEIQRRQEERRKNNEARADPLVRQMLEEAFERLGLEDPQQHFRNAIAIYGRDAVLEGIAIFEGKKNNETLPPNVDARYLLGIVKNLYAIQEGEAITKVLIEQRIDMHDRQLRELETQRSSMSEGGSDARNLAEDLCMKLVEAERNIDQQFWIVALGKFVKDQPNDERKSRITEIANTIQASFSLSPKDRLNFIQQITRIVWPVS